MNCGNQDFYATKSLKLCEKCAILLKNVNILRVCNIAARAVEPSGPSGKFLLQPFNFF